jgi:hypothetical protein
MHKLIAWSCKLLELISFRVPERLLLIIAIHTGCHLVPANPELQESTGVTDARDQLWIFVDSNTITDNPASCKQRRRSAGPSVNQYRGSSAIRWSGYAVSGI